MVHKLSAAAIPAKTLAVVSYGCNAVAARVVGNYSRVLSVLRGNVATSPDTIDLSNFINFTSLLCSWLIASITSLNLTPSTIRWKIYFELPPYGRKISW
ncbi:hypothetical protein vBSsoS008_013 [Shigella phage vB_SsoS_008]|nr:hypothetical protein vBSsoS008_013 [Shigella phage vB_SsoS_008]